MKYYGTTRRELAHYDKLKAAAKRTEKAYVIARDDWLAARLALSVKYGSKYRVPIDLAAELAESQA